MSTPPTDWQIGHAVLDTYRVTSAPGEWTHGWVYKVRHLGWEIDLALSSR